MKTMSTLFLFGLSLLLSGAASIAGASEENRSAFGAFYTKVDSGEEFEKYSRTGPRADIVVRGIGPENGRLVFWRGSSYLPYWEVGGEQHFMEELTERSGDGPRKRPDKVNTYSRVKIVENTPERVVVHWRYLPRFEGDNPHFNKTNIPFHRDKIGAKEPQNLVETREFVDEYFVVEPDGDLIRKFKEGTERYGDWLDTSNALVKQLRLVAEGIENMKTKRPSVSKPAGPAEGRPVVESAAAKPFKWWKFDEGAGDKAREAVGGDDCFIAGHDAYWKKGVSGTALAFDGYTSRVELSAADAAGISGSFTLEAWVAVGAYPWNWAPIVKQEDAYYLGVGPHGRVAMKVHIDEEISVVKSDCKLERRRWYHLCGTYDHNDGRMRLYIDGEPAGAAKTRKRSLSVNSAPVKIGQGEKMSQSNPVRANTFVAQFSFDGLIDEVRIYNRALTPARIAARHNSFSMSQKARATPDLDERVLPAGLDTGEFGAYYAHLDFYDTWDGMFRFGDHPDVVVEFDQHPTSFVFWRGTCYIPMIVNEQGEWYSNEFNETWNRSGGRGCMEPMSDKESYSNHVKILENTPARCVVLWRYPLIDVLHTIANYNDATGWGDWSDWIYTIYPDGVAAKEMVCWTDGSSRHEWQEGMVITGPDQHPEQVLETDPALRLITLDGEVRDYSWKNGPPKGVNYKGTRIHVVNYKGKYDPFTIAEITRGNVYSKEVSDYSVFPSWNHWPVAQMPSDGRYAKHPDRTAHSSLTHIYCKPQMRPHLDAPYERMVMLEGMSKKSPAELIALTKSWLYAPTARARSGCDVMPYNRARREYPVVARADRLSFVVDASEEHPLENICFTVRNWGRRGEAKVRVDGKAPVGLRQGTAVDTDGRRYLVVWIEMRADKPVEFSVGGARPFSQYSVPEKGSRKGVSR